MEKADAIEISEFDTYEPTIDEFGCDMIPDHLSITSNLMRRTDDQFRKLLIF